MSEDTEGKSKESVVNVVFIIYEREYRKHSTSDGQVNLPSQLIQINNVEVFQFAAPGVGIEPTTNRLTGDCSTAELSRNIALLSASKGLLRAILSETGEK